MEIHFLAIVKTQAYLWWGRRWKISPTFNFLKQEELIGRLQLRVAGVGWVIPILVSVGWGVLYETWVSGHWIKPLMREATLVHLFFHEELEKPKGKRCIFQEISSTQWSRRDIIGNAKGIFLDSYLHAYILSLGCSYSRQVLLLNFACCDL